MDEKWQRCRWRTAVIIFTLFIVGFVIQTVVLRNDSFTFNKDHALRVLHKVFLGRSAGTPGTDAPGTGDEDGDRDGDWRSLPPPACRPKSHIVFLNTHKTESATIQNILYRYGEGRRLTFALPRSRNLRFSYPHPFQARFVEGVDGDGDDVKEFHILCNHMRFRKSEVAKVMPADALYVSMLRHPVSLTQSVFMYSKVVAIFSDSHVLDALVEASLRNSTAPADESGVTVNNMAFDFGFNSSAEGGDPEQSAATAIRDIERDFHLLLIQEYLDESLVLLRHALCWSLEDVATFRRSGRGDQLRSPVSADTAEDIKRWNALDWRIYQHFNATFWQKVETAVGVERMKREVSALRELQAELTRSCLKGKTAHPEAARAGREVNLGFNLDPGADAALKTKCQKLLTPALQYTYKLYDRQFSDEAGSP